MKPKTKLSTFDNHWYKTGAGLLKRSLWYVVNVVFFINPLNPFSKIKVLLLRWFGAKIGKDVVIKPSVNIKYPWKLTIGDDCWLGENVWIDNLATVSIGNDCCISQGAMLLCGSHNYKKTSFDLIIKNIRLEEGVWIGAKSIVMQGVLCESHSILSALSVASTNLTPYSIYKGNPAIKVKDRIME